MGKISFNISSTKKKPISKRPVKQVVLEKAVAKKMTNEMYTYIGSDGKEYQYTGIINKTIDGHAYGKIYETINVELEFHPKEEHKDEHSEYFTYIDPSDNKEYIYKNKFISYDEDTCSYIGNIQTFEITKTPIQIFEEK